MPKLLFWRFWDDVRSRIMRQIHGGERVNNFQKIKEMNIDELAVFLFGGRCSRCAYFGNICNGSFFDEKSCTTGIKKFLAEEVL